MQDVWIGAVQTSQEGYFVTNFIIYTSDAVLLLTSEQAVQ